MVKVNRKWYAVSSWDEENHAVSKFKRAITMKITVDDRKRTNIMFIFHHDLHFCNFREKHKKSKKKKKKKEREKDKERHKHRHHRDKQEVNFFFSDCILEHL